LAFARRGGWSRSVAAGLNLAQPIACGGPVVVSGVDFLAGAGQEVPPHEQVLGDPNATRSRARPDSIVVS
jgi:hypothetical protein